MNCINLKNRTKKGKKYIYCVHKKQVITFENCKNCSYKKYKVYKPIRKRTQKLIMREKSRYSIIYQNLTKCCVCGSNKGIELNEIYEGSYRQRSIKYGAVAPMCHNCHRTFHNDYNMNLYYKVKFQKEFLKTYSIEEFIDMFGQNYIYKQKNIVN